MNWWTKVTDRRTEIVLPEPDLQRELRRKTRRDFLIGGLAAVGAVGGYEWIRSAKQDQQAPWPERRVLEWNGKLARSYLSNSHLMPTYSRSDVEFLKVNGDIGVEDPVDHDSWRLQVTTDEDNAPLRLTLADIKALPKVEMITKFCCIEGWSVVTYWGGARFADFTKKYFPPDRKLPDFVYMATPNEDYYVGLDTKSALHPQTLLAYEHNGKPLEDQHGAPLRLAIPVKYGIKNIKRIGMIQYTNTKPGDYWAEEGYDWFAGL
ncbi:MAG: molybdopterin-dependent oxidoreductase [Acidobacteriaceae bacterium]|nr:molybdopterin-dependent oxidoreductase [Acidobacteriaceae bacterium]